MVIKYNNLSREEFIYKFLEIVDCMQIDRNNHTTDSEKRLLIEFFTLPEAFIKYRFSRLGKKEVIESAAKKGWKLTYQNINNKIYDLISKNLLYKEIDGVVYMKKWLQKAFDSYEAALKNKGEYDFKFRFTQS